MAPSCERPSIPRAAPRGVAGWWLLVAVLFSSSAVAIEPVKSWWAGLALRDLEERPVEVAGPFVVVMFLDPECPVANRYVPAMNALAADFSRRGFSFFGAYADPAAALATLRAHARDFQIRFPTLDDRAQRLARGVGAGYSAEAVVLDGAGNVLYRGRVDDRVGRDGAARPAATRQDLRQVLQRLAAGERGPFPGEAGFGCALPPVSKKP